MTDQAGDAAAHFQADLGQLGRLARARLAADDRHLVVANCRGDVLPPGRDGQVRVERELRDRFPPGLAAAQRLPQILLEPGQPLLVQRSSIARGRLDFLQRTAQAVPVSDHCLGDLGFKLIQQRHQDHFVVRLRKAQISIVPESRHRSPCKNKISESDA